MNAELALLEALEKIERDGVLSKEDGLCLSIYRLIIFLKTSLTIRTDAIISFSDISTRWCDFSGNEQFPIPHHALNPDQAYTDTDLYTGQYGAKRLELLHFAADYQRAAMGVKP